MSRRSGEAAKEDNHSDISPFKWNLSPLVRGWACLGDADERRKPQVRVRQVHEFETAVTPLELVAKHG
jgi:hypothetical protein